MCNFKLLIVVTKLAQAQVQSQLTQYEFQKGDCQLGLVLLLVCDKQTYQCGAVICSPLVVCRALQVLEQVRFQQR